MPWVRLDDAFASHPKIDGLSDGAFRLHVAALCDCARFLTDGRVAADRPARLVARFRPVLADELVRAGLWTPAPDGWEIHDYLTYQPSRAKVEAEREAAAERQAKSRARRAVSHGVTDAVTHGAVTAPRPGPTPLPTSSNGFQSSREAERPRIQEFTPSEEPRAPKDDLLAGIEAARNGAKP